MIGAPDDPTDDPGDEAAPGPDAPDDDVVYDTDGWTNRQRAKFTEALLDAGISHEWSGSELVVARQHEGFVDGLIYPGEDA